MKTAYAALALLPLFAAAIPLSKRDNVTSSPFSPSGGVNVSLDIVPTYRARTDFDFQSFNLALNQEWIELDLFHYGLAKFSDAEFAAIGMGAQERYLLQFMADQEVGHARLITNILGQGAGALSCTYDYSSAFTTVSGFIDFCQKLTRWGESGVYGFLGHLDDQSAASLLLSSIVTEARQQYTFSQFEGIVPMDQYFVPGIPQAWAWTLLQPYIVSCPAQNPRIKFQIFPTLHVDSPNVTNAATGHKSAVAGTNLTQPAVTPGQVVHLNWDAPGQVVGYNRSQSLYTTNVSSGVGKPAYAAFLSHINLTYTELFNVSTTANGSGSAITYIPNYTNLYPNVTGLPSLNQSVLAGTIFIAVTDSNTYLTPFNLTGINNHMVAGPAMFQYNLI